MMVSASRLSRLLSEAGFALGWENPVSKDIVFLRPSSLSGLFERVVVTGGGKRGERVFAEVWVTVVRGPCATKGLVQDRHLVELAEDPAGWATVASREDAEAWERKLAQIASTSARLLAEDQGANLLQRTDSARRAVARYAALIPSGRSLKGALHSVHASATEAQILEGDRLATFAGVLRVRGAEDQYALACTLLAVNGDVVEGKPSPFGGASPLENTSLMWRIQLLTDEILVRWPIEE
jgi:hypothetical protein